MTPISMTALSLARRFEGIVLERPGEKHHPLIQWWHSLAAVGDGDAADEVSWCSSFVNGIAWELSLPRSKSAAARSWLKVGRPVSLDEAEPGFDVVVFWRVARVGWQGHVGFYAGRDGDRILCLGGNQSNSVTTAAFGSDRLLGVRRLETA